MKYDYTEELIREYRKREQAKRNAALCARLKIPRSREEMLARLKTPYGSAKELPKAGNFI